MFCNAHAHRRLSLNYMQETKFLHTLQNRSEANKMIVHDIYIRKSMLTVVASVSTSTFSPSAKSCPTVRASSLPQCKAEQNPNWKEHNGTQNTKTSEGVLQHANPAKRENRLSQGHSPSLPPSHHSALAVMRNHIILESKIKYKVWGLFLVSTSHNWCPFTTAEEFIIDVTWLQLTPNSMTTRKFSFSTVLQQNFASISVPDSFLKCCIWASPKIQTDSKTETSDFRNLCSYIK